MSFTRNINCLDEVPFSVHELARRVKKIQLSFPYDVIARDHFSKISDLNYDSSIEEHYLSKREAAKKADTELLELQKQFEQFVEEQKKKLKNGQATATAPNLSSVILAPRQDSSTTEETVEQLPSASIATSPIFSTPQINNASMAYNENAALPHAINFHLNQNIWKEILVPSRPILKEKAENCETDGNIKKIDLKDFENEQDPFENISLKVINDIEELDKVFLASSSAPAVGNGQAHQLQLAGQPATGYHNTNYRSTASGLNGFSSTLDGWSNNTDLQFSSFTTSKSNYQYPIFTSRTSPVSSVGSCDASFNPQNNQTFLSSQLPYYHQAQQLSMQNQFHHQQQQSQSFIPTQTFSYDQISLNPSIMAKNFYFNNFINVAGKKDIVKSKTSSTNVFANSGADSVQTSLRHAKSSPDITKLNLTENETAENETAHGACEEVGSKATAVLNLSQNPYGRYTPPLPLQKPTRPDKIMISYKIPLSASQTSSSFAPALTSRSTHDHYHHFKLEKQSSLLDKFTMSGFSRDNFLRAISKFSTDEARILNHLCNLKNLTLKGHDPSATEECLLHLVNQPVEKIEDYLQHFEIYFAMGFPTEKIHEALKTSNMDSDRTLDFLTGC